MYGTNRNAHTLAPGGRTSTASTPTDNLASGSTKTAQDQQAVTTVIRPRKAVPVRSLRLPHGGSGGASHVDAPGVKFKLEIK